MDSELSLELPNASTSRDQFGALSGSQAAVKSAVDSVLPAPAVHGLVADTQAVRDVLDAASGHDKVQHPLTKLRGVTASSHAVLPCLGGTAAWSIPIIRLQEIQGALRRRHHPPVTLSANTFYLARWHFIIRFECRRDEAAALFSVRSRDSNPEPCG